MDLVLGMLVGSQPYLWYHVVSWCILCPTRGLEWCGFSKKILSGAFCQNCGTQPSQSGRFRCSRVLPLLFGSPKNRAQRKYSQSGEMIPFQTQLHVTNCDHPSLCSKLVILADAHPSFLKRSISQQAITVPGGPTWQQVTVHYTGRLEVWVPGAWCWTWSLRILGS